MLSTKLVSVFSLLILLAACAPKRPDADLCWVNAAGNKKVCYNALHDYDSEGYRKPDAQPKVYALPNGIKDLNLHLTVSPDGQEEILRFMEESRRYLKERCK